MKLLLHTDSPTLSSGLSRCGREIAERLYKQTEFAYAGWHHMPKRHSFPYFIYPIGKGTQHEEKEMAEIISDFQPDILLSVGDVWNFVHIQKSVAQYKEIHPNFQWILWLTVDGDNMHPIWQSILDQADDINVFSKFGQIELQNTYSIPSTIIYPGVDKNIFCPIKIDVKENTLPFNAKDTFLVLNINQNTDRKNLPLTLAAFRDFAFGKKDVFLLLVTDPEDNCGYDLWDFIRKFGLKDVVAITKEAGPKKGMSDAKLNTIYNLAAVSLNTSIGEGLSMPTLEAMACGTPVIATDYAAISELIDQGAGFKLKLDAYIYGFNGIRRAIASKEDLVDKLNILYQDYKTSKQIKTQFTEKGIAFTDKLTWDNTVNKILDRVKILIEKQKQCRVFVRERVRIKNLVPLVIIPSFGTHCGIAEYTKSLFDSIRNTGQSIVAFSGYNYSEIVNVIKRDGYSVAHIQHEFSFFKNKEMLKKLLDDLHELKVKTVLTIHTLAPGLSSYNEILLTHLDDLIVHSQYFKDRLLQRFNENKNVVLPETCNIEVIPMGCGNLHEFDIKRVDETKNNLGINNRRPIIGSFGFLRDQKGYNDILLAIKKLRDKYPDILLLLICPQHEFGSKAYDEAFFNFIERQGMQHNVLLIREYLEEEKLLDVLQCVDVFMLNYKDSPIGGGISAAVKTLFRVQRPIIVNDSIAFCDLTDEVMKIKSISVDSIIEPIEKVLNDKEFGQSLVTKANEYVAKNNWDEIARRHLDLYSK